MRTIALTFAVFSSLRQHPRQNSTNWATNCQGRQRADGDLVLQRRGGGNSGRHKLSVV